MRLIIEKNQLPVNPELFLRRAGYGYIEDRRRGGQGSFVRRFGSGFYPRFHMYIERQSDSQGRGEKIIFNLHLDQKQASYAGSHAHSGEYDGPLVAGEMERIKFLASQEAARSSQAAEGNLKTEDKKEEGWWTKIFN